MHFHTGTSNTLDNILFIAVVLAKLSCNHVFHSMSLATASSGQSARLGLTCTFMTIPRRSVFGHCPATRYMTCSALFGRTLPLQFLYPTDYYQYVLVCRVMKHHARFPYTCIEEMLAVCAVQLVQTTDLTRPWLLSFLLCTSRAGFAAAVCDLGCPTAHTRIVRVA
jgi:hypothetical protein